MQRTSFLLFFSLCLLSLPACTTQTLDGGSTGATKGAGTGAGADIADAPLSGTIAAQPFEAKAIDIHFNESRGQWFLSIDNYESDCGSVKDLPDSDLAMTANVVGIEPAAGAIAIEAGATRYATLQRGVYEVHQKTEPDARPVKSGTLVLDSWTETPGATISGKLKLFADEESQIEGTFTATVCPAR